MTPETYLVLLLGIIAFVIWFLEVPERYIRLLHLRAVAVTILVAAAITPTPDILSCLLNAGMYLGGYFLFVILKKRLVARA